MIISLVILISCNVNSYDCDVFAEEKNEEQNTETDIICNWPEDIIDPDQHYPNIFLLQNHEYIEYRTKELKFNGRK